MNSDFPSSRSERSGVFGWGRKKKETCLFYQERGGNVNSAFRRVLAELFAVSGAVGGM